jgi:hypothetical protein
MSNSMNANDGPLAIGSRLEPLVDDYLFAEIGDGIELRLHAPVKREVVLQTDAPCEGNACLYRTVMEDEFGRFRMYYGSWHYDMGGGKMNYPHPYFLCYAESLDGRQWDKPSLGLVSFEGDSSNNIVLSPESFAGIDLSAGDTAIFLDTNPACQEEARYKALVPGRTPRVLYALQSADGIRFSLMRDNSAMAPQPVITQGYFDSQNLAFWDGQRGEYRAYFRDFRGGVPHGVRGIKTTTSTDFLHWTESKWLDYGDHPEEPLYTNQIRPYARAPHILFGFPMRYIDRGWVGHTDYLPGLAPRRERSAAHPRYGSVVTDGLFMSSRDGETFKRWGEAYIRPGPNSVDSWVYGDNCIAWGLIETEADSLGAPPELSLYVTEGYWQGRSMNVRRYSTRIDGFVSLHAPLAGGACLTKPLIFDGRRLFLNYATSAAGSLRVEIQDHEGRPVPGFSLEESEEIFGDSLNQVAHWAGGSDLGSLSGRPIRIRFALKDADLYSIQFRE